MVTYDHDGMDRLSYVRESGAMSGIGVLAHYTYDPLSRTDLLDRGNGTSTDYGYDLASHLTSLTQELAGTDQDLVRTFGYYDAGQLRTRDSSNSVYEFEKPVATEMYAPTALNT